MTEAKACADCGETKTLDHFQRYWNNKLGRHRHMAICKACRAARRRADAGEKKASADSRRVKWQTDPEYKRNKQSIHHKWRYGITLDEKDAMLAAQGGVCAVCKTDDPRGRGWVTDHDHSCCPEIKSCGKCIRGVLCTRCNFALGQFDDDPDILQCAIDYLDQAAVSRRLPA